MSECIDEFGVIPFSDVDRLAYEVFEDTAPQPRSIYDEHQEAIFQAGLVSYDKAVVVLHENHDNFIQLPHVTDAYAATKDRDAQIADIERSRNRLLASKVIYEMKRGNDHRVGELTPEITDYHQRLRVLDAALQLDDDDGALSTLIVLGDLRREAEDSGDPSILAAYLMVELRNGMNIHANSIDISIAIKGVSDAVVQAELTKTFNEFMNGYLFSLIEDGQDEYAALMSRYADYWSPDTVVQLVTARDYRTTLMQKYPGHKITRKVEKLYQNANLYERGKLTLAFPKLFLSKHHDLMNHSSKELEKATGSTAKELSDWMNAHSKAWLLTPKSYYQQAETEPDEFDVESAKRVYYKIISQPSNIFDHNEAFDKAVELSEHVEQDEDGDQMKALQLSSETEICRAELEGLSKLTMDDMIDRMRFKQEAVDTINSLLSRSDNLTEIHHRFRTAVEIFEVAQLYAPERLDAQAKEYIQRTALKCLSNPIAALSISRAELEESCAKLGVSLESK
jgi:hypothetical protein